MVARCAAHGLRYLHPVAFLTLAALAEVLIEGEREVLSPDEVARNVDRYLADLEPPARRASRSRLAVLGVWPLLTARPPLPLLAPETRKRFLEKRSRGEAGEGAAVRCGRRPGADPHRLADVLPRLLRRPPLVGLDRLQPFSAAGRPAPLPGDDRQPPLCSLKPPPRGSYDTIVDRLGRGGRDPRLPLRRAGRKVLVLERGPHVDPREFGDDEVVQYLRLYNEGALQLATDFGLQVLQGMCVGGGTTINNALCLDPPDPVLEQWEPHGLDRAGLKAAIARGAHVARGRADPRRDDHGGRQAVRAGGRGARPARRFELMEANISPLPAAPATATSAARTARSWRRSTPCCRGRSSDTGSTSWPTSTSSGSRTGDARAGRRRHGGERGASRSRPTRS